MNFRLTLDEQTRTEANISMAIFINDLFEEYAIETFKKGTDEIPSEQFDAEIQQFFKNLGLGVNFNKLSPKIMAKQFNLDQAEKIDNNKVDRQFKEGDLEDHILLSRILMPEDEEDDLEVVAAQVAVKFTRNRNEMLGEGFIEFPDDAEFPNLFEEIVEKNLRKDLKSL